MLKRVIPSLLINEGRVVKTVNFKNPNYIGDPLNVIDIFNSYEVDEIIVIDIGAARGNYPINLELLRKIAKRSIYPLTYGGGISGPEIATSVIRSGFEKIAVNQLIFQDPSAIKRTADIIGAQAIVASLNYSRAADGLVAHKDYKGNTIPLIEWKQKIEVLPVGEIFALNVDREGTMTGFDASDLILLNSFTRVPLLVGGGISSKLEIKTLLQNNLVDGVVIGSLFDYYQSKNSVLVNYPSQEWKVKNLFASQQPVEDIILKEAEIASLNTQMYKESKVCRRCVTTSDVPGSGLEVNAVCSYCELHDELSVLFPQSEEGLSRLAEWVEKVKLEGKGKKYDCIVGVSGGTDSSFLCHLLSKYNLRILAVHFDNTWNSADASRNIFNVIEALKIDLHTYVVDNHEYADLYRSFLLSGVKDIESPTDIGFMGVLYRVAEEFGVKNIAEGHSFRTEGVAPMRWSYMDGRYIQSIQKQYGKIPLKTFPNMTFNRFFRWAFFSGIKRTRPLYWIDYNKEDAKKLLSEKYNWKWYGGHHLENKFTSFFFSYFLPNRFKIDYRQIEFSALIRSGQISKDDALFELGKPRTYLKHDLETLLERLSLTASDLEDIMNAPRKSYKDYKTYKKRFEVLRPLFWILMKQGKVPASFYEKYCKPDHSREIREI